VEAHSVLSDPRRRERYDLGEDEDGMSAGGGPGMQGGVDLSELFAQFAGGGGGFPGGGFPGGGGHGHSHGGFRAGGRGGPYAGGGFPF
jgi:DnaJ family protein C protein 7